MAVNANNNTAVINMGLTGSKDGGLQVLNLATNTFGTPLPLIEPVRLRKYLGGPDQKPGFVGW